jgi:hypothetical protein
MPLFLVGLQLVRPTGSGREASRWRHASAAKRFENTFGSLRKRRGRWSKMRLIIQDVLLNTGD